MTIKPVSKGGRVQDALSADTWNAFVRAANANDLKNDVRAGRPGTNQEDPYSTVKVLCSTAAVAKREVLGLSDPSILPAAGQRTFDNRLLFAQTAPLQGRFGLAELAGSQNVYNRVISDGVVQCTLEVPANGEWITRADIDSGNASRLLATPNGSAQILWKETGTGEVPAIVRLGNPEVVALVGVADATIPAGGSGIVSIWQNNADTLYNIPGVLLDWMHDGLDISAGREVLIAWFPSEQVWRVIGAQCEENPPAVGQLADDGVPTNQILDTTPAPWNSFVVSEELGTSNVTLDSANATITVPANPDRDHVYRFNYSGSLSPNSNNNTYLVDFLLDGSPSVPTSIDARQANSTVSFAGSGFIGIPSSPSPHVFQARIYMLAGSDNPDWQQAIFNLERNLDF